MSNNLEGYFEVNIKYFLNTQSIKHIPEQNNEQSSFHHKIKIYHLSLILPWCFPNCWSLQYVVIGHFTVYLVVKPLIWSEAEGDLVVIETSIQLAW